MYRRSCYFYWLLLLFCLAYCLSCHFASACSGPVELDQALSQSPAFVLLCAKFSLTTTRFVVVVRDAGSGLNQQQNITSRWQATSGQTRAQSAANYRHYCYNQPLIFPVPSYYLYVYTSCACSSPAQCVDRQHPCI